MITTTQQLYRIYLQHPCVCTDTRKIAQGDLFFALHGANFDGNDFALKALESGAAYAVVDRSDIAGSDPRLLLVSDTLIALQQLAAYHRAQLDMPVIAITGTNGKTTTKELVRSVLETRYHLLSTEGNLNNHIGVPLMILRIRPDRHQMALIEMGAGAPGEIALLCNIAQPTLGLITNIGKAHLQGFGSIEGVLDTKSELPTYLQQHGGAFLLNANDPLLSQRWRTTAAHTYGTQGDYVSGCVRDYLPYLSVEVTGGDVIATHLVGAYNLVNVLAAIAVGKYFGVSLADAKQGIESYQPTNNRSQLMQQGSKRIIVDAYNANPSSMLAALNNLHETPAKVKVAILGDMLELGQETAREHAAIIDWLAAHPSIVPLLCGKAFCIAAQDRSELALPAFESVADLNEHLQVAPLASDALVLVKGSRGIALEQALPFV